MQNFNKIIVTIFIIFISSMCNAEFSEEIFTLEVSSSKKAKEKFNPLMAFDNDPKTCWAINSNNSGINEKIKIETNQFNEFSVNRIGFINGFGITESKFGNLYKLNNRVKAVKVTAFFSISNFKRGVQSKIFILKDTPLFQFYNFKCNKIYRLEFEILDVFKGSKWNDTCISEIKLFINDAHVIEGSNLPSNYVLNKNMITRICNLDFKESNKVVGTHRTSFSDNKSVFGKWRIYNRKIIIEDLTILHRSNKYGSFNVEYYLFGQIVKNNKKQLLFIGNKIPTDFINYPFKQN